MSQKNASLKIENSEENFSHSTQALNTFAPRLLAWFETDGRHDLPWQQHQTDTPNPYIVWLSEVMLQQTQVTTVLPYFARFMDSFPTVQDLAAADWDTIAEHWAGMGYYARARNLHKGAKQLVEIINDTGDFPQTLDGWEAISGVGPSTAGAIMAMGLHKYGVICDGNVKRVLTRWAAIDGDITKSATNKELWALAKRLTPLENSGLFAQAMMDMGATLCVRRSPACQLCPLREDCIAHAEGRETDYPVKAKKKPKPSKFSNALLIENENGEILWLQRPDNGIWGGLWSLPLQFVEKVDGKTDNKIGTHKQNNEVKTDKQKLDVRNNEKVYETEFTTAEQIINEWLTENNLIAKPVSNTLLDDAPIRHSLTHFHWYLQPQSLVIDGQQIAELKDRLSAADVDFKWLGKQKAQDSLGLPRAMIKVLEI
ncbi:A/G-specific adenine glycosylase [uncultured Psychrobacter sp.]|uniref:A/G-specific adenine glycosylase n=1 Tax=uncultured Psychrobacter sp. TaxID=259303 RepID=UPI0034584CE8